MSGDCPSCDRRIVVNDMAEIVRCPYCREAFPPEYLQRPMGKVIDPPGLR